VYGGIVATLFELGNNYDFTADPKKTKSAASKKLLALYTKVAPDGTASQLVSNYLTDVVRQNAIQPKMISIANEINAAEGGTPQDPIFAIGAMAQNPEGRPYFPVIDKKAGLARAVVEKMNRAAINQGVLQYLQANPPRARAAVPAIAAPVVAGLPPPSDIMVKEDEDEDEDDGDYDPNTLFGTQMANRFPDVYGSSNYSIPSSSSMRRSFMTSRSKPGVSNLRQSFMRTVPRKTPRKAPKKKGE
jgi:hypothetical protein